MADRTASKPIINDQGEYQGGTAYERSKRAVPVRGEGRCYTNAHSVQNVTSLVSLVGQSKMTSPDLDEHQKILRSINHVNLFFPRHKVVFLIATSQVYPSVINRVFVATGPTDLCEKLEEYGSVLNTPSAGAEEQHLFTNVQVNMAPANPFGQGLLLLG